MPHLNPPPDGRVHFLMVAPTHYEVSYAINPWMAPGRWRQDPVALRAQARACAAALRAALEGLGARVELATGTPGLPDLVFTANAAVVLNGRALLARFRHAERRGEEARNAVIFHDLMAKGLLSEVAQLPVGCFQEGAGDCLWDATRGHFWAGFGPRSAPESVAALGAFFAQEVVPLELVSERCYHLDVGFCVLSGGHILYLPSALAPQALASLYARVAPEFLIEATEEDLLHFNINAVCLGRTLVMSRSTPRLQATLAAHGYRVVEVDLAPFMLSGGGAFCLTLNLSQSATEPSGATLQ